MKKTTTGKKLMVFAILGIALICVNGCGGGGGGGGGETEKQPQASDTVKTVNTDTDLAAALKAGNSVEIPNTKTVKLSGGATLGGNQKISGGGTLNTSGASLQVTGPASITGSGTTLEVETGTRGVQGLNVTAPNGILNLSDSATITVQGEGKVTVAGKLNVGKSAEVTIGSAGNASVDISGTVTINGADTKSAKLTVGDKTTSGSLTGTILVGQYGILTIETTKLELKGTSGFDNNASIVYSAGAQGIFPSPLGTLVGGAGADFNLTKGTLTQTVDGYTLDKNSNAAIDPPDTAPQPNTFPVGVDHTVWLDDGSELTVNGGKTLYISNYEGNGTLHIGAKATLTVNGTLTVGGTLTANDGATITVGANGSVTGVKDSNDDAFAVNTTYKYTSGTWVKQ